MPEPDGAAEIELKFQVPAARLQALERRLATRTAQALDLRATYFDTADGALARRHLVLRVRREGDRWVQALKGPGDGLMQRLEDEVVLPDAPEAPAPDLSLHSTTEAGRALAMHLADDRLLAVHGTDIRRLKRVLRHRGARIEAALDQGEVSAGGRCTPVRELELELLDGPLESLLDLAMRWVPRHGLVLDPTTKSERAQWLRDGLEVPPVARVTGAGLVAALAQALPNAAALAAGSGTADHLAALQQALERLPVATASPPATLAEAAAALRRPATTLQWLRLLAAARRRPR